MVSSGHYEGLLVGNRLCFNDNCSENNMVEIETKAFTKDLKVTISFLYQNVDFISDIIHVQGLMLMSLLLP